MLAANLAAMPVFAQNGASLVAADAGAFEFDAGRAYADRFARSAGAPALP